MTKVLVVYGSRHGGTRGIAERIGEVLQTEGLVAEVVSADQDPDLGDADGIVVGSGVYMGSWLKEPLAFLERNAAGARDATAVALQQRPTARLDGQEDRRRSTGGRPGPDGWSW